MAYPTILVDSVNGAAAPSASGAGPATAVTGTNNATSDGATPSVISLGGSPDLSGVATDGSHCIYLNTGAGRKFSKITAVDNGAKTVTIEDTITGANCTDKSWAIGGKLSSLWGTGYVRLVDDASSSGDAKGGWIIEFQSAHAETQTTTDIRPSGDTTNGPIIIRGASGAGTKPVITTSYSDGIRILSSNYVWLYDFTVKQTTSAANFGIKCHSLVSGELRRMTVYSTGGTKATSGIRVGSRVLAAGCEVYDCLTGIDLQISDSQAWNCYVHDCATTGIDMLTTSRPGSCIGNIIVDCGIGIKYASVCLPCILFNIVDTCTTGLSYANAGSTANSTGLVANNLFVNCTTGFHHNDAGSTEMVFLCYLYPIVKYNGFWNNTTHMKLNTTSVSVSTMEGGITASAEPFTIATKAARKSAGQWDVTTELKAAGFPSQNVGMLAATRSYVDIGIQRQESGGSGGVVVPTALLGLESVRIGV